MMGDEQAQAQAQSSAAPRAIYVEGVGLVPVAANQTPQQAIDAAIASQGLNKDALVAMERVKREQAKNDPNFLGVKGPGGQGVGVQMPDPNALSPDAKSGMGDAMTKVLAAFPQLAAFAVQALPQTRAFGGVANSTITPMAGRALSNLIEGKPAGEGVIGEGALGAAAGAPAMIGKGMVGKGIEMARRALATSPRIDDLAERFGKGFVEEALPTRAVQTRAAATHEGVQAATDRAVGMTGTAQDAMREAKGLLAGIPNPSQSELELLRDAMTKAHGLGDAAAQEHALANVLEDLRYKHSMVGPKGGPSGIVPGSGVATTAVRAAGATPAIGQVIAPAVGVMKGTPARKLAVARNLYAPGGIAESDLIGEVLSQLLRLGSADHQARTGIVPAVSHAITSTVTGSTPRRRGQQ